MCAIRDGRSIDTSMGLTPLEGLIGGSRSGSLDPSLVFHLFDTADEAGAMTETKGIRLAKGELALNKESGLVGLCGTQEFGDISEQAEKGSKKHRLALDVFERPIVQHLGGYLLLLEGRPDAVRRARDGFAACDGADPLLSLCCSDELTRSLSSPAASARSRRRCASRSARGCPGSGCAWMTRPTITPALQTTRSCPSQPATASSRSCAF